MSTPNPRTRYGMVGGLAVAVLAVVVLVTPQQTGGVALLLWYSLAVGGVAASVSAVGDAYFLARAGRGPGTALALVGVLLFGPLYVLFALCRRPAWRGSSLRATLTAR